MVKHALRVEPTELFSNLLEEDLELLMSLSDGVDT